MTHDMSVILTVVDGAASLRRCLAALRAQEAAPSLETIVAYDDTVKDVAALKPDFPEIIFIDLGNIGDPPSNALEEHELIDKRRAAGLAAASAPIIAMIEDRGPPQPGWARAMIDLHTEHPHAVIGGGIVNKAPTAMLRDAFKCDYARYEPPAPAGERDFLTDINLSYKRAPLLAVKDQWADGYKEVPVHDAIVQNGGKLLYSPNALVELARQSRPAGALLAERFHWGRVVARIRGAGISRLKSLGLAAGTPLLPFLLLMRIYGHHRAKGRGLWQFIREAPPLFLLLIFWSIGEFMGYIDRALSST